MHSLFKQTSIRSFIPISVLRERLLSLIVSVKQAWVQHLIALMIATLLSFSLVCIWAQQAHSISADRVDTSLMVFVAKKQAFRQQGQPAFQFAAQNLAHQAWEGRV